MTDRLQALADAGVSIWLDDLSRERIETGNLAELIKDKHVVGVTTNPTIFAAAIANGERYDEQVGKLVADGADVTKVIFELTTEDVRNGCDIIKPVAESHHGRRPGLDRGRARPGQRHRGHHRLGPEAVAGRRPAQRLHQDPRHRGGAAGDHRGDRPGHQRQRHADLQRRALPRASWTPT